MSYSLKNRIAAEKSIIKALVVELLKFGHSISVFDGECFTVKRSKDKATIVKSLYTTDEDQLRVRDNEGNIVGWFYLVYGNDGYDVISDYTSNDLCNSVYDKLRPLMDKWEDKLTG